MSNTRSSITENSSETIVELSRLNGLSDSVFAFALTLLVLDIRLPDNTVASNLPTKLLELAPRLLIYLISFAVIGGAWGSHQRMLSQVRRGDGLLVWLNLLSLLVVTFLPASASLLGQFPGDFIAIACFAVDVILIQLTALWLWRHASKHGLINAALDPRVVVGVGRRLSLGAVAFALSLVFALFSTTIVYVIWIGLFIFLFVTDWLSWEQTLRVTQSTLPLEGAKRGRVDVVHGAGLLHIDADASDNALAQGTFGGGLVADITRNGDQVAAHLQAPRKLGFMSYRYPWAWNSASALDWTMRVNPHIPLELDVKSGADQVELILTESHITALNLEISSSGVEISLPENAGQTSVHIHATATSFTIRIPADVAAHIHSTNAASDIVIDSERFPPMKNGIGYVSSNYETAVNRVEIELDLTVSFVKVI